MQWNNRYFLLRHGKTIYQTEKKGFEYPAFDNPPTSLIKEGEEKVLESVKELKNKGEKIDLIFSSDFLRTKQTSAIAAKELGLNEVIFDQRLRDTNIGVLHNKSHEAYAEFFGDESERFQIAPTDGETWNDVRNKMKEFIKEVDQKYKGKNILIVSHGDPLWLLAGVLLDFKEDQDFLNTRYKELYPNPGQIIQPL